MEELARKIGKVKISREKTTGNLNRFWWKGWKRYRKRKSGKIDWVDLSAMPFLPPKSSKGSYKINWRDAKNIELPFYFGGRKGSITYVTHIGNSRVIIKYNNNLREVSQGIFLKCGFGGVVGEVENNFIYHMEDVVNNEGDIVVNRFKKKGSNWYTLRCNWSGEKYDVSQTELKAGSGSPYKRGLKVCSKNDLTNHPEILKFLKDENDSTKFTQGSGKKVLCMCPQCGFEKKLMVASLVRVGFSCEFCSGSMSFGERYVYSYLEILEIKFFYQYRFSGLKNRFYDFYLPEHNTIIETHGKQHYTQTHASYMNLEEIQTIDRLKKEFVLSKDITYCEINCSVSTTDFIKKRLPSEIFIPLSPEQEKELKNRMHVLRYLPYHKSLIEDYQKGLRSKDIQEKYGISNYKLVKILKEAGVHEQRYNPSSGKDNSNAKAVRCVTTGQVFDTVIAAARWLGKEHTRAHIISVCKGRREHAGKHPETNELLKWEYVKEELKNA